MRFYLDTETTGFSRTDALVEIALVRDDGTIALATLIDPERPIGYHARRVHGITPRMVRGKPRWRDLEPKVLDLLRGATLVAHNASFDLRFTGRVKEVVREVVCTFKLTGMTLPEAAAKAGYVPTGAWHRATADAMACRAVHHHWLTRQASVAAPPLPWRTTPAAATARDPRLVRIDPSLCPAPTLRGQPWTDEADRTLLALWTAGRPIPDILAAMPRTPLALFMRLEKLGAIPRGANPYAA